MHVNMFTVNNIWIFGQIINELGKTFFREYERGCLLTVVSAGGLFLFITAEKMSMSVSAENIKFF